MKKTSYLMFELSCSEIVKRRRSGGGGCLNLKWIMLQSNSRVTNDIAAFELCSQDKLFAGDTRGYIGAIYKWDKANPFTRQECSCWPQVSGDFKNSRHKKKS